MKSWIFQDWGVQAILEDNKTMTRRIVKIPEWWEGHFNYSKDETQLISRDGGKLHYPPKRVGDIVYVREAWQYAQAGINIIFRADSDDRSKIINNKWRSPLHLSDKNARSFLKVKAVKVEKACDISLEDIEKEGLDDEWTVQKIILPIRAKLKTYPEHWAHGGDEGLSYCYECCKKKVRRLRKEDPKNKDDYCVDGGWGTEGDSFAFCETCGKPLDNTYTRYACESELDHYEQYGFDLAPMDYESLDRILGSEGWDSELSERIRKLSWQAVWKLINGTESWKKLVWAYEFERIK